MPAASSPPHTHCHLLQPLSRGTPTPPTHFGTVQPLLGTATCITPQQAPAIHKRRGHGENLTRGERWVTHRLPMPEQEGKTFGKAHANTEDTLAKAQLSK